MKHHARVPGYYHTTFSQGNPGQNLSQGLGIVPGEGKQHALSFTLKDWLWGEDTLEHQRHWLTTGSGSGRTRKGSRTSSRRGRRRGTEAYKTSRNPEVGLHYLGDSWRQTLWDRFPPLHIFGKFSRFFLFSLPDHCVGMPGTTPSPLCW